MLLIRINRVNTIWLTSLYLAGALVLSQIGWAAYDCQGVLETIALETWRPPKKVLDNTIRTASKKTEVGHSRFAHKLSPSLKLQFETYLRDGYEGLESMRGENGLVKDIVYLRQDGQGNIKLEDYKTGAAPTDIALDLLIQAAISHKPGYEVRAIANIKRNLEVLSHLPFHGETGLFYRSYGTKREAGKNILDADVSSVDNLHLALALWTLGEKFKGTEHGNLARQLFDRMNFSSFFDPMTGLVGGNLKHERNGRASSWRLEEYRYHFGSEARSIYTVGYALGLFRDHGDGSVIESALKKIPIEIERRQTKDAVRVWDGGIFQALLPRVLVNEELYSSLMGDSAGTVGIRMLRDAPTLSLDGERLKLPAGHSASVANVRTSPEGVVEIEYSGKLGHPALRVSTNPDSIRNDVITMYAVLLGAGTNPMAFSPSLAQVEKVALSGARLYLPGFGWVDSVRLVRRNDAIHEALPNTAGVGVDKAVEVLALLQILDPDGLSESGRQLWNNPQIRARLGRVFRIIDERRRQSRESS